MSIIINLALLIVGFIFTFFVPGFLIIETFFEDSPSLSKIPLYMLLSVMVSTYLVYLLSIIFGYSLNTILVAFSLFLPWMFIIRNKFKSLNVAKEYCPALFLSLIITILFFLALYPAIFTKHNGYFVMSGVNWQDTANHLGIIESISQGNFPSKAPYYSGVPLSYYHFTDFHTAILQTLYGDFFPRTIVYDNPFFVFIFSFSLYALTYHVTRNHFTSAITILIGTFAGNLMFIRFVKDFTNFNVVFLIKLLTNNLYSMEYGKLMQVVPMADYFLQNRPMMVGLPTSVLVGLLVYEGFSKQKNKMVLLAGLLSGMLIQFQAFAFLACIFIGAVSFVVFIPKFKKVNYIKLAIVFLIPVVVFSLFTFVTKTNTQSIVDTVRGSLQFGPWDKSKNVWWYVQFYLLNFHILLVISTLSFLRFVYTRRTEKSLIFLYLWFIIMLTIPNLIKFTIFDFDMYKFFYLMVIPMSIIVALFITQSVPRLLRLPVIVGVLLVSSFTSILVMANSILNKNFAYSQQDYSAGIWIRNNTPTKSVFISMPTVHDPPTQIGGRLRVLSYINWPYSHGYNTGSDNVFIRLEDIKNFYLFGDMKALLKYRVNYVYYGPEEKVNYPQSESRLDTDGRLKLVYHSSTIKIYEVNKQI